MNRRGLMLGAAGASALLLAGCLGGAKGEDFVGFWAQERTHNGVTQVIGVSRIERVSANEFMMHEVNFDFFFEGVRRNSGVFQYFAPNRLRVEIMAMVSILEFQNDRIITNGKPETAMRRSNQQEFDGFPAYAEKHLRRPRRHFM
ncbi:MAG: hypothetical protein M1359_10840 [Betaproteobacteria bacterium]|nr:hypothetical protein [Betaproteobacteria bacterium]